MNQQETDRSLQGSGYIVFDYFWRIINSLKNEIANISGGGQVNSVVAGVGVNIDSTDPANPIASFDPQSFMESLPDYEPDADYQTFVRMADGTFICVIVDHQ